MKKIVTVVFVLVFVSNVNSQDFRALPSINQNINQINMPIKVISKSQNRALVDTLMYMPLPTVYVNQTDSAGFQITKEDVDLLNTNNTGVPTSFGQVSSTDTMHTGNVPWYSNFYHPWERYGIDTSFYWYATSWFNPAGTANNWLNIGPLTIPSTGAYLSWYDRTNPGYRDGYKVYCSTNHSSTLTHTDFTDTAIFTRTDGPHPPVLSSTALLDTTWVLRIVQLPSTYNGQTISIGFNHNANDEDVLYLDEIKLTLANPLGISDIKNTDDFSLGQNIPNPFNNYSIIPYNLNKSAIVSLTVYDIIGNIVMNINQGEQQSGSHSFTISSANLLSGVYYYNLNIENNTTLSKKMVIIK